MSAEQSELCSVRGLRVVYGRGERETGALDGVDLEIARGERVAIVGDSGSGKSTLALALARLLPQDARVEGTIRFDGRDVTALDVDAARALRGASIGMVFQDSKSALHPLMRVEDQVAEAWTAHARCSKARALEQARAALARVGLDERASRAFPHELSGGMRQRVQIATALALQPKLLVLDEPTTALDTVTQKKVFDLVEALRAESGFALLLVTHDLALAVERCDRIVRLGSGRVIEERGSAEIALHRAPRTRVARGSESRESVLEARALGVAYTVRGALLARRIGPRVVDDVSLTLARGETLALVGNSGSGKTSLVRGLLRLVEPVSGASLYRRDAGSTVDLCTLDARALRDVRPDLGIVFQDPTTSLDPRQRARDALVEALTARRASRSALNAQLARLLDDVGLSSAHLARFPHQLSGGEAQRLGLARALATKPRVIVLDEALSSLDPPLRRRILDLLVRLQREEGLACLLVTHDLGSVESFADRVAVMASGRIVETGPTETIFSAPSHAETRALLAARAGSADVHAEIAPQDGA